jgi:hypothetical protein
LVWECNELQTWEKPWPSESSESLESSNLIGRESIPIGTAYDKNKLLQLWMKVLKRYSSCGITLASDKMIALSGVASAFQLLLDDEYYAGVWKSNYAEQLCWRAASPRSKPSYRPTPYRAPSWSWASVEAQVDDIYFNLVELIEIKTSLVSADFKTGPVTSGSVTLSARLIPSGHWEPYIEPTKKHSSSSTALPWASQYKGRDILIYSRGESFTNVFPDDESDFDPQRMVISYVPILSHVFMHMVSLAVFEVGEAALDSEPTTAVYRRVGVCEIHLRNGSPEERDKTRITII